MPALDTNEKEEIQRAIAHAEHQTSAEIRVCIEKRCSIDPIGRAAWYFKKLEMEKTELRNAVLIYIAHEDRKFAIIGDSGIHKHTGNSFWDETRHIMEVLLRKEQMKEALLAGIQMVGLKMKLHFPFKEGGHNQLSDEIIDKG